MRPEPNALIEPFRANHLARELHRACNRGSFVFRYKGSELYVIASDGMGWDHVSVSTATRCPTWEEMCYIASLFFRDDEVLMQLRPAREDYINCHPYCLHWWRPQAAVVPQPPTWMIGPKKGEK